MLHFLSTLPAPLVELLLICFTVCFIWFLTLLALVPALTKRIIQLIEAIGQWRKK